jgi:hypothetical protein
MQQGYALIAAAMVNDPWMNFNGVAMADGGFIRQEMEKLMKRKNQT